MKKIFFLFALLSLFFISCEEDSEQDKIEKKFLYIERNTKIVSVDQILMVRAYAFPMKHLILEFANGKRVCIAFAYYDFEPHVGMEIPKYSVYKYSSEEAYEIVTEKGTISMEAQLKEISKAVLPSSSSDIASSKALLSETGVVDEVFEMGIRHALTWDISSRFSPIRTFFFRIDGTLYYLPVDEEKDMEAAEKISKGDKVLFQTMLICKNRLTLIKKT